MPAEIRVPSLGESIVEATVARWMKKEGQPVAAGEPVVELETEKVNVEVPAPEAGVLAKIDRSEGETVAVGDLLGAVDAGSAGSAAPAPAAAAAPSAPESPRGEEAAASPNGDRDEPLASPLARRVAADTHVDLHSVRGSGPGGRIVRDDVESSIGQPPEESTPPIPAPPTPARRKGESPPPATPADRTVSRPADSEPVLIPSAGRPEERVRMSRRRLTIAHRLVEAQRTAAMLTTFNEVDMSAVMEIRTRRKEAFKERHGVSLGFMSFFCRAALGALKAFPSLNAEIQGEEIVLKRYYDLGIAVSTEQGLVVPVVRDADRKTFAEIESTIAEMAGRARSGKLTLTDLQGGTFTITNGGVFGSLMSTPILNGPQVGILGMHKIEERPIARDGQVVIRPMMYLALSYDHRIVDGSEAVRFLVRVKELVEDPESLLLEG